MGPLSVSRGVVDCSRGRTSGPPTLAVDPLSEGTGVVSCSPGRTSGPVVLVVEALSTGSGVVACVPSGSLVASAGAGTTPVADASSAAGRTSGVGVVGAARKAIQPDGRSERP